MQNSFTQLYQCISIQNSSSIHSCGLSSAEPCETDELNFILLATKVFCDSEDSVTSPSLGLSCLLHFSMPQDAS